MPNKKVPWGFELRKNRGWDWDLDFEIHPYMNICCRPGTALSLKETEQGWFLTTDGESQSLHREDCEYHFLKALKDAK